MNSREKQWDFFCEAQSRETTRCIEWPFSTLGAGYPSIKDMNTGRVMGAHRLACEMRHGPPREAHLHAAHECGNSSCINPNHIKWKTPSQNAADKKRHGTNNDGEKHGLSVLANDQVKEIRRQLVNAPRGTQARLSREYGVSPMTISQLARGRSYKPSAIGEL